MKAKFEVTLKDPDGAGDCIRKAALAFARANAGPGLDGEQREELFESAQEKIGEKLKRWLTYGECLTVEFDLDAMTATVKEASE